MHTDALAHFRRSEQIPVKRLYEVAERARHTGRPQRTDFLTPREAHIGSRIAAGEQVAFYAYGGHEGAERQRGWFGLSEQPPAAVDYEIACLQVAHKRGAAALKHGDYLGSLLGLGLQRDRIGDIVIDQDREAYVFCLASIAPYLILNWNQAGRTELLLTQVEHPLAGKLLAPRMEERMVTLQSLRLDAFVGHAFGMSRTKALEPIKAGKVQLNFVECTDPSEEIRIDDIVSLRGSGRARVLSIAGQSRSGRTFVGVGRYI